MLKVAQLLHSLVVIFVPVFPNRGVVEPTWDPFIASQPDHDIPRTGNPFGTAWEWSVFPTFASHGLDVVVATGFCCTGLWKSKLGISNRTEEEQNGVVEHVPGA